MTYTNLLTDSRVQSKSKRESMRRVGRQGKDVMSDAMSIRQKEVFAPSDRMKRQAGEQTDRGWQTGRQTNKRATTHTIVVHENMEDKSHKAPEKKAIP